MNTELQKKVEQAIKLIQFAGKDGSVVEVAYSGGKDSDVILELAKMSGIKFRAIYKNTTIDPPGTIKHVKENGVEIIQPKHTFFQLVEKNGFPNRFARHCCKYLKEYKVLDRCIMGVRRDESIKRKARYAEPTECRFYGSKKEHVEAFYPILEWSDKDVVDFIVERKIKIHPLYFTEDGRIDPTRRLGCMCCPLASNNKRKEYFKQYPKMVRAYIRAGMKFRNTHTQAKTIRYYNDAYEWFYRDLFCEKQQQFEESRNSLFGKPDYKKFLEEYFNVNLEI